MRWFRSAGTARAGKRAARTSRRGGVGGCGASVEVRRENLPAALRLVAEALREPSFPAAEFDEMKRAALTAAEGQRGDPGALAGVRLARHLYAYPEGHPHS